MKILKKAWRRGRTTQPFNLIATGLLRAAGFELKFLGEHLPRIGLVKFKLPNGRLFTLWSHGDDYMVNQVYWHGWDGYEPETSKIFFTLAENSQCTLDIGAHVGFYSILAAHANPKGHVYALEPFKPVFERLTENVRLNTSVSIHCFPLAASDHEGTEKLFHVASGGLPTNSSFLSKMMDPKYGEFTSSQVQTISLDAFVKANNIERVDLIKIDTEGTEPQVLKGMMKTLERDHPTIVCEVLPQLTTSSALTTILGPLGYKYYWLNNEGPILVEKITGREEHWNYIFTTKNLNEIAGMYAA